MARVSVARLETVSSSKKKNTVLLGLILYYIEVLVKTLNTG